MQKWGCFATFSSPHKAFVLHDVTLCNVIWWKHGGQTAADYLRRCYFLAYHFVRSLNSGLSTICNGTFNLLSFIIQSSLRVAMETSRDPEYLGTDGVYSHVDPLLVPGILHVFRGHVLQLLHLPVIRKPDVLRPKGGVESDVLGILVLAPLVHMGHVPREVPALGGGVGREVHNAGGHAGKLEPRVGRRVRLDVAGAQADDAGDGRGWLLGGHELISRVPELVDGVVVEEAAVPEDQFGVGLLGEVDFGEEGRCGGGSQRGETDGDLLLMLNHGVVDFGADIDVVVLVGAHQHCLGTVLGGRAAEAIGMLG